MPLDRQQAEQDLRETGFHVVPSVLTADELARARGVVDATIAQMRAAGVSTHSAIIDPNEANVRLYNLPNWNPEFIDLLGHPVVEALVELTLGANHILSNFTGNVALPGSKSMKIHSDQALVIPPPWNAPWAMNIIWCIDDVHEANGATRYVPGSHKWKTFEEVPADVADRSRAFSAPAGSVIAMEGRVWHTSGANVTADERRAMLFAYYSSDFIRPQVNWEACLSPAVKDSLHGKQRSLFGLGPMGNTRIGGGLVRLNDGERPDVLAGNGDGA
jgi:ectoine hydroxylase-related dioxygenase (phytanoyl-CoA dioxygenase family)